MQDKTEYLKTLLEQRYPDKVVTAITDDRSLYYEVTKLAKSKNLSLKELFTSLGFTYIRRHSNFIEYNINCIRELKSTDLFKCSDEDFRKVMQEIMNVNHLKDLKDLDALSHRYYNALKRRAGRVNLIPKAYCEQTHIRFEHSEISKPSRKSNISCRELLYLSSEFAIEVKDIVKLCNVSRQYVYLVTKELQGDIKLTDYSLDQEALGNVENAIKIKRSLVDTEDFYMHLCKHKTENKYIILYKDKNSNTSYYTTDIPARILKLIENNFPTEIDMTKVNKTMTYIQQNKEKLGYKVSSSGVGYITKVNMTCYAEITKILDMNDKTPFINICKTLNIILDLKPTTYRTLNNNQQQLLMHTLKQGYIFAEGSRSPIYKALLKSANRKEVSLAEYLEPYGVLYLPLYRYHKIFED